MERAVTTSDTDEEKPGIQRVPAHLAQAIAANFDELHRLAEKAAPEPQPEVLALDFGLPSLTGAEPLQEFRSGRDFRAVLIDVIAAAGFKVVTRTEKGDHDRFDLDLNVSLQGLDAYEVECVQRAFSQHLRSLVTAARQENSEARITQLLRAVAPPDPLAEIELKVAQDTIDLRREFLERIPVLTSAQVHERAGFPGANPSATGHRWRKQGKVFSISHGGRELYPAFQFGPDGRPLPIIGELLTILAQDKDLTDWDHALWFAGESGWLDGKTPIELLQSDPEGVKRAAEQELRRDEP
jgi:hypothetical protein